MRSIIEHHAFAEDCARLGHPDSDAVPLLAAQQFNLAFEHQSKPLARGRFVKEIITPLVSDRRATLEDGRQFIGLDANALGGFGDSIGIEFHEFTVR